MVGTGNYPTHLEPSKLGTKEYWDRLYTTELSNHASNPVDEGTVWFDDSDAEAKVVQFVACLSAKSSLSTISRMGLEEQGAGQRQEDRDQDQNDDEEDEAREEDLKNATFLDLGCGNGSLLLALRDAGWGGEMRGVDYSPQSVTLATQVQKWRREQTRSQQEEEGGLDTQPQPPAVQFSQFDILTGDPDSILPRSNQDLLGNIDTKVGKKKWDVLLDKGTFDAISLSSSIDASGRRISEGYRSSVLQLVRPAGLFVITSCNWTEDELRKWFESPEEGNKREDEEGRFAFAGRVQYRSFSFGGVEGQTISTIAFRKVGVDDTQ